MLNVEPAGTVTRTEVPPDEPPQPAATATIAAAPSRVMSCLTRKRERMLEKHGGRKGIDIALSPTG